MGGDVEHEEVGATGGAGEDASVHVQTTAIVAVGAIEGQVFLAATIVGLASVSVEVHSQGLAGQGPQVGVLLHHLCLQVADVVNPLLVLAVSPGSQLGDGVLSVAERLVLSVPGGGLSIGACVKRGNVSLTRVILALGEVLKVGNVSLASVILSLSKVLEVGDLLLARIVLGLCPAIEGLDLLLPGAVLRVQLAIQLGNICDSVLVILLLSLLKRLDLVFPQVIFSLCGVDEGIVILLEGVVISSQGVNL